MRDFKLEQWLVTFRVLQAQRDVLAAHPRLTDLLPDIDEVVDLIVAATGHVAPAAAPDAQRQAVAAAIGEASEAHRFVYRLIEVFAEHGPAAHRPAVKAALAALYPEGLSILTQDWSTRAGAAEGFAQRAASEPVQVGLASVRAQVPALPAFLEAAVTAGRRLGAAVTALAAANAAAASAGGAAAFPTGRAVLAECRSLWADFASTLERSTRRNRPEDLELRSKLLATYEAEAANVARRVTEKKPKPQDADPAPPPEVVVT